MEAQSAYIPAPIDGVDYVSPVGTLPETCARELKNFYVFDWGIKQVPAFQATGLTHGGILGSLYSYSLSTGAYSLISVGADAKIYVDNVDSGSTVTNTAAGKTCQFFYFNSSIFLLNGTDTPRRFDTAATTWSNSNLTGPTMANLIQGCNFKGRACFVEKNTGSFWYGGIGQVSGAAPALTEYPLRQFLRAHDNLLFVESWSYNQGLNSEDLFVAVTVQGQVLIYSGDSPNAPNWQIIARAQIPRPVGNRGYCQVGQEFYVMTNRGLIPLSRVFAGKPPDSNYFSLSKRLGPIAFSNLYPCVDNNFPFIYFIATVTNVDPAARLYAFNYERGAWFSIDIPGTGTPSGVVLGTISSVNVPHLVDVAENSYAPTVANGTSSAITSLWKTDYLNFGKAKKKRAISVRPIMRHAATASVSPQQVTYRAAIAPDFDDSKVGDYDAGTIAGLTVAANYNQTFVREIKPPSPNSARWYSYFFSKVGSSNEQMEYMGAEVFYELGDSQ